MSSGRRALSGVLLTVLLNGCGGGGGNPAPSPAAPPTPPVIAERAAGFDFGPYLDGQSPLQGTQIGESQLTARMQVLQPLARAVRTYSMTGGLENAGRVAHTLGMNITVGAFLSADAQQNDREITNLLAAAHAGATDAIVIAGSEVLERNDLSEADLIAVLRNVRRSLPSDIQLGYADTAYQLLAHPLVVDEVDVVFANIYPYFDGVPIDEAMRHFDFIFTRLQAAVRPKPVVISETGWPGAGPVRGAAVPSTSNAAAFFSRFAGWAKARHVDYFYFEAFDEAWKVSEGAQGPHWGVLDSAGNLKSGMDAAFSGAVVADQWTRAIPGGTGVAQLLVTGVPAVGSFENLQGQLQGVDPALYRLAVFIFRDGLWFVRPDVPLSAYPFVDGSWSVDITTQSGDEAASRIAVYLLPVAYRIAGSSDGTALIPPGIIDNAVTMQEVMR